MSLRYGYRVMFVLGIVLALSVGSVATVGASQIGDDAPGLPDRPDRDESGDDPPPEDGEPGQGSERAAEVQAAAAQRLHERADQMANPRGANALRRAADRFAARLE